MQGRAVRFRRGDGEEGFLMDIARQKGVGNAFADGCVIHLLTGLQKFCSYRRAASETPDHWAALPARRLPENVNSILRMNPARLT